MEDLQFRGERVGLVPATSSSGERCGAITGQQCEDRLFEVVHVRHRRGVTVTDEPDPHLTVHDAALPRVPAPARRVAGGGAVGGAPVVFGSAGEGEVVARTN